MGRCGVDERETRLQSGGFQEQLSFDPAALQPFNSLELNGSVFFYGYEDLLFYGGLLDLPVGVLFGITNVGDAEVRGAEADLWWRPAAGFDFRLGLGWLDTEITKSVVDGVATGSELPNAPECTFSSMVRYEWPITGSLTADLADEHYRSQVIYSSVG